MKKLQIFKFDKLSSTQTTCSNILKNIYQSRQDLYKPVAITTKEQFGGKGRKNRKWIHNKNNLAVTYGFWSEMSRLTPLLCQIAALSVVQALQNKVCLKWPNDIFSYKNEKIGGILFDSFTDNDASVFGALIGIGINLNSAPEVEDNKTTIISSNFTEEKLLKEIWIKFAYNFELSRDEYSLNQLIDEIEHNMLWFNEEVKLTSDSEMVKGKIVGIDRNGGLKLETDKGERILSNVYSIVK